MAEQELSLIATKVVSDTKFWIALVGVIGAIVGSALTIVGNFVIEWFRNRKQKAIDDARRRILKEMLQDEAFEWRDLSTLSAVVGCDEQQTKTHLIAIGARGSEKSDDKWGLITRHPLTEIHREKK